MSSSSLLGLGAKSQGSQFVRRFLLSALVAATLVCGVVVGEGSAFARGGGGGRGGGFHGSRGHVGYVGRPAPYRHWAPGYAPGYAWGPGYVGWRAAPRYGWGVGPGWGRGYVGRGYVGGGRGYVGRGGHAGGGRGGHR